MRHLRRMRFLQFRLNRRPEQPPSTPRPQAFPRPRQSPSSQPLVADTTKSKPPPPSPSRLRQRLPWHSIPHHQRRSSPPRLPAYRGRQRAGTGRYLDRHLRRLRSMWFLQLCLNRRAEPPPSTRPTTIPIQTQSLSPQPPSPTPPSPYQPPSRSLPSSPTAPTSTTSPDMTAPVRHSQLAPSPLPVVSSLEASWTTPTHQSAMRLSHLCRPELQPFSRRQ